MSNRWVFRATLITRSPLHIGDGELSSMGIGQNDEPRSVSTTVTDLEGRAYMPGTTIKGCFRSWLENGTDLSPSLEPLFGSRVVIGEDDTQAVGGLLEFADSRWHSSPANPGSSWDDTRKTCITTCVAIDRRTGAPAHEKLFSVEYVPPGTKFDLRIYARNLADEQAAIVLALLHACENEALAPRFGAASSDGWGRIQIESGTIQVRCLRGEAIRRWLLNPGPVEDSMETVNEETIPQPGSFSLPQRGTHLRMIAELRFEGPFLINDPSRSRRGPPVEAWERTDQQEANFVPLEDDNGNPVLPVSSLRGCLRARAEKIWYTLNPTAPLFTTSPRAESDADIPSVHSASDIAKLSIPCTVFGASGWGTLLEIPSIRCINPGLKKRQELLAIDRFTGGGADGAKFVACFQYKPRFEVTLEIPETSLKLLSTESRERAFEILAYTLQDLADGLIPVGYGKSKGYGRLTAQIRCQAGGSIIPENWRNVYSRGFSARILSDENQLPQDPLPPLAIDSCNNQRFQPNYNFLPTTGCAPADRCIPVSSYEAGNLGDATHHVFTNGTFSGQIECRLTADSPLFIGATRLPHDNAPAQIDWFKLHEENGQEYPAIPATSLRGMISSIYEALTQSSLRVLANTEYSKCKSSPEIMPRAHAFFAQIDPNLLPLTPQRLACPNACLTPAELVFGCVESREKEDKQQLRHQTISLAGRVSPTFGRMEKLPESPEQVMLDAVTLKVLSSPKPPSPAMYFHREKPKHKEVIMRKDLRVQQPGERHNRHFPNGRKVYILHNLAKTDGGTNPPWQSHPEIISELWLQQVTIKPIRSGTAFRFSLHFEGLSRKELAFLMLTLQPASGFRHRLGMGKPLGLGAVHIDILGVDYFIPEYRYNRVSIEDKSSVCYPCSFANEEIVEMLSEAAKQVPQSVMRALRKSGTRAARRCSYPIAKNMNEQADDAERELFRWFVNNNKLKAPNVLPLLEEDEEQLPTLPKT